MSAPDPFEALGRSLGAAITGKALTDVLGDLMLDLATVLDLHAISILVATSGEELDLLSATSHRMADLEMYQAANDEGPCVDCLRTGGTVMETGAAIAARWPVVGAALAAAGFRTVLAIPMLWRGEPIAGLNLFWRDTRELTPEEQRIAETFAAAATLMLGQTSSAQRVTGNVVSVLHARVVVEQAKGALAFQHGLDLENAYVELRRRAHDDRADLADVARALLSSFARPRSDHD
ncbi:GAF and ANTAR domain-containing protein [Lapillicoccus sp.]|uniref:GAF and ANTAR domain-containing protein n=1 Tax=Lapillicoccus sp. TaxID=1909287 RepID=UPI0025D4E4DA|nr:GAF and ANTAR domain-containing protein [Lapillicoccus sp.]